MLKKIFILIKVVVFIHLLFCLLNGKWTATFNCLFNLILLFVSDLVYKKLGYSSMLQISIYLFITGSLLLGEVYYFYAKLWYFDIIMHVLSSFVISGLIFYIIKFYKIKINIFMFILFIFSFAMMVAALWEITEFTIDRIFSIDMQKDTIVEEINSTLLSSDGKSVVNKKISSMKIGDTLVNGYIDIGLYDTIEDMVCAVVGSLLFIIIGRMRNYFNVFYSS